MAGHVGTDCIGGSVLLADDLDGFVRSVLVHIGAQYLMHPRGRIGLLLPFRSPCPVLPTQPPPPARPSRASARPWLVRPVNVLLHATIRQTRNNRLAARFADRKLVAVDLAFYLPGRVDRTQPGAVWTRGTERR
jgi:hypothetical protein